MILQHQLLRCGRYTSTRALSRPAWQAMWNDGKAIGSRAHNIAQDIPTREGSWVHAYLHRKEGDSGNANYWYNRAGPIHAGLFVGTGMERDGKVLPGVAQIAYILLSLTSPAIIPSTLIRIRTISQPSIFLRKPTDAGIISFPSLHIDHQLK